MEPRCITCKRPISGGKNAESFPFCTQRCKLADLGSWLSGGYVVTGTPPDVDPGGDLDDPELLALLRARQQESS